jgi:hypothetical protein
MYSQMADKLKTCTRGQDFFIVVLLPFLKSSAKVQLFMTQKKYFYIGNGVCLSY